MDPTPIPKVSCSLESSIQPRLKAKPFTVPYPQKDLVSHRGRAQMRSEKWEFLQKLLDSKNYLARKVSPQGQFVRMSV